jgi:Ca2+/Na+ antiporter
MLVYTVPPSSSYVIFSDMLLVIVVCLLLFCIHVCSLIYVPHMQMLNCWSLYISYVFLIPYFYCRARLSKKQKQNQQQENIMPHKKWVAFKYFSPLIRRVTSLFKQISLKVAFCAVNTIQQQLTEKQIHNNPSGIYRFKCNTCNKVYDIFVNCNWVDTRWQ